MLVRHKNTSGFLNFLLFGNVFYALCAVALAIETLFQLQLNPSQWLFHLALFFGTIAFYIIAYFNTNADATNPRLNWYQQHKKPIFYFLILCLGLGAVFGVWIIFSEIGKWSFSTIVLLMLFPIAAILYYGDILKVGASIRQFGLLKPFIVAFVWAGAVTIYPAVIAASGLEQVSVLNGEVLWFFFKNLMFIASLCILFDIKDYADDANANIKTFVVRFGLRKTLYRLVLPLIILGWLSLLLFL